MAKKMRGVVTWFECKKTGLGFLSVKWENGRADEYRYDGPPISDRSNADDITGFIGNELGIEFSSEHDREHVFIESVD